MTEPNDDEPNPEAWQRWQLARFDAPLSSPAATTAAAASAPSPSRTSKAASAADKAAATAAAAARELEQLRQAARDAGHAEGHAAGLAEGRQQAHNAAQRLSQLAAGLETALDAFDQHMAKEVLALSLAVARQILRQHIEVHPESLLPTLRELLAQLHHPQVLISLHPDDAALLRSYLDGQPGHEGHRLHEDPRMQRGGCVIDAGGGQIDARMETRWQRVVESLGSQISWLGEPDQAAGTHRRPTDDMHAPPDKVLQAGPPQPDAE